MNLVMMILLIAVAVECLVLLVLALARRLTKRFFAIVASISAAVCLLVLLVSGVVPVFGRTGVNLDQREYLYMAARLLEQDDPAHSLEALGAVTDEDCGRYGSRQLRGLAYNMDGAYATAVYYLENCEEDNAPALWQLSLDEQPADETLRQAVIQYTLEELSFSEREQQRLDAELRLRFLTTGSGAAEQQDETDSEDLILQAKAAIADRNTRQAFDLMAKAAQDGGVREAVVVSQMYVYNYDQRTLAEPDSEYDLLLQAMTSAEADLARADLARQQQPGQQADQDYQLAAARYQLARDRLTQESVKRAVNYLEACRPADAEQNIAYQLQMAYLYYQSNQYDAARQCLDHIFGTGTVDRDQWMGLESALLLEAYLTYDDDSTTGDFDTVYRQMMAQLYLNILQVNDSGFCDFLREYFRDLLSGIRVGNVDYSAFPQVTVSLSSTETEITTDTIRLEDTGEQIREFTVEEQVAGQLSVCYVLDLSGSMMGRPLNDAVDAIQTSLDSLAEGTQVGLVTFENTATVQSGLTTSTQSVASLLGGLQAYGGTNISSGLQAAAEVLEGGTGERIVVLVSDGVDGYTEDLPSALNALNIGGITVYTVGLTGCDRQYLDGIARETGGSFVMADSSSQLADILAGIQQAASHSYLVTYQVADTTRTRRELRVTGVATTDQAKRTYNTEQTSAGGEDAAEQASDYFRQIGGTGRG